MKNAFFLFLVFCVLTACERNSTEDEFEKFNWNQRAASLSVVDSLEAGTSYLSIYSQIYSLSQHKKYNLTAMVSLRNTSETDTIYILKSKYYDTHGKLIKNYIQNPVYMLPMETIEIVINEADVSGGTGSNFIFNWKTPKDTSEPIFEAVMTSTVGSQGLSFTTHAKRIN